MLNQIIQSLTGFIQNLYSSTGLLGIVLAMAVESCCIPLPSEIVMPLAGSLLFTSMSQAGAQALLGVNPHLPLWLNLILLALAGSLGCLLGSLAAYGIGYAGGRPLMLKYGKYVLISQHDADKADQFFQRWGAATAFFSRMLPVVRTYISLPAGITRMNLFKFSLYSFLGSFPWCLLLAFLGYQLGQHYEQLSGPLHYFDGAIVVAVVVLVVLYVWRHIRNDRRARAEHASAESSQQPERTLWGQPSFPPAQGQSPLNRSSFPVQQPVGQQSSFQKQPMPPSSPQQSWGPAQANPPQWGQPQPTPQQWGRPAPPSQSQPGNNPAQGNSWPR